MSQIKRHEAIDHLQFKNAQRTNLHKLSNGIHEFPCFKMSEHVRRHVRNAALCPRLHKAKPLVDYCLIGKAVLHDETCRIDELRKLFCQRGHGTNHLDFLGGNPRSHHGRTTKVGNFRLVRKTSTHSSLRHRAVKAGNLRPTHATKPYIRSPRSDARDARLKAQPKCAVISSGRSGNCFRPVTEKLFTNAHRRRSHHFRPPRQPRQSVLIKLEDRNRRRAPSPTRTRNSSLTCHILVISKVEPSAKVGKALISLNYWTRNSHVGPMIQAHINSLLKHSQEESRGIVSL